MPETQLGHVKCSVGAESLVFADRGQADHPICIPIGHIPDLIRFLDSLDYRGYMRAFRVPVDDEAGLEVSITDEHGTHAARPNDISLVGISANLNDVPEMESGTRVSVHLKLDNHSATLAGIVRRHENQAIGVEFSTCFRDGCLSPPDELRQIVAPLEIRWIRQRAGR